PSSSQSYGAMKAGGNAVARSFSFTSSGLCGGTITATLQLQDGALNLGPVSFSLRLGAPVPSTTLTENFDEVSAPVLPSDWIAVPIPSTQIGWVVTNGFSDTAPNSAFATDASLTGIDQLVSPIIPVASPTAQLTFRHNYNLASHTTGHSRPTTTYYDGGVLE